MGRPKPQDHHSPAACHGRTQPPHQQASTSSETSWAPQPASPETSPTYQEISQALGHLGLCSQLCWEPAPHTSGLKPAQGHPGPCSWRSWYPAPPTSSRTPALGPRTLQPETPGHNSAYQLANQAPEPSFTSWWAGTSPGIPGTPTLPTSGQTPASGPPQHCSLPCQNLTNRTAGQYQPQAPSGPGPAHQQANTRSGTPWAPQHPGSSTTHQWADTSFGTPQGPAAGKPGA